MQQQSMELSTSKDIIQLTGKGLGEVIKIAEFFQGSELVPTSFRNKPADIVLAWQTGAELGLSPTQSLKGIAVINGKTAIYGDTAMSLVRGARVCEFVKETFDKDTMTATCVTKRRDEEHENTTTFSMDNAKTAKLWGKTGPWTQYPERMLKMRARAFNLRDTFADLLSGIDIYEDIQDIGSIKEVGPTRTEKVTQLRDLLGDTPTAAPVVEAVQEAPQEAPQDKPMEGELLDPVDPEALRQSIAECTTQKELAELIPTLAQIDEGSTKDAIRLVWQTANRALQDENEEQ